MLSDEKNKPEFFVAIFSDITERKQAEEVVKRSEERLTLALEGTWSWDHNYKTGEIVRNERWAEILGYTLDEIKPSLEFWKGLIHPDDLQRVIELMENCEEGKTNDFKAEYSMRTKSGEWKWILDWDKIVERDNNDKPLRAAGTHLDITERKRIESKLKQNGSMLRQIIDTTPNCIFVKDRNGMYLVVNKRMAELHNTTPEELVGKYDYEIAQQWFEIVDYNEFRKAEQDVIDNKKTLFIIEEPFVYHDGTERWFQTTKIPFELEDNQNCLLVIAIDITERKLAEEVLKESEKRYGLAVKSGNVGVWDIDLKTNEIYLDPHLKVMLGYKDHEIKNNLEDWAKHIYTEDSEITMKKFQDHLDGKTTDYNCEHRMVYKDGSLKWFSVRGKAIFDDSGKPIRVIGTDSDITKRKRAEEILLKSERRLKNAQELSKIGDYEWELDTAKITWSDGLYKLFGFPIGSHITKEKLFKHIHPDDLEFNTKNMKKWLKEGGGKPYEYRIIRADGAVRNIYEECDVVYNEKGKVEKLFGVVHDITERKQVEEKLKASEERFRSIFSNISNIAIQGYDKDRKVTFWNKASEKLYGYSRDDAMNKQLENLIIPPEMRDIVISWIHNWHENNIRIPSGELVLMKKDKSPVHVYSSHVMIESANGKKEMFCIDIDITERKQAEEKLREYSKSQAILIKEINHRVRNNLSEIISVLYSEQELAERKGKLEYLSNIHNIIMRIKGLSTVHSMLSESKWKPLRITHLCERIVNEVIKSLSSSKDVNLLITSSDFLISSNKAHYLGMVINELATNSIKYAFNKRDKLNINIDIEEEEDTIVLHYRDDGPGYPRKMFKEDFSKEGIGFELIQGIVKHSLLGDLELKNDNGAVIIITFKNIQ